MENKGNQKLEDLIDWNGIHQVSLEVDVIFNKGLCFAHVYRSLEGDVVDTFSKSGELMSTNCYFNEDIERD